jgi:hypothetical protein
MYKPFASVLIEALVVGAVLLIVTWIVRWWSSSNNEALVLFLSGCLFHLLFEYTGLNKWYATQYCETIRYI